MPVRRKRCHICDQLVDEVTTCYSTSNPDTPVKYCSRCLARVAHFTCLHCHKVFIGYATRNNHHGEALCHECRSLYWVCEHSDEDDPSENCNRFHLLSQCGTTLWCQQCYEREGLSYPPIPGHYRDTFREEHDYDSDEDDDEREGLLSPYEYKPAPQFKRLGMEPELYIGFELEVTSQKNDMHDVMSELNDELNSTFEEHIYFKHDGSLSYGGFEIVSQPMTPEYIRHNNIFGRISKILKRNKVTSHDSGCCGLHFHVCRDYFNNLTDSCNKIAGWLSHHDYDVTKISRRTQSSLDNWACINRYTYGGDFPNNYRNYTRSSALNLEPRNTIEFRFFRGNTREDRLVQSLNVIESICILANQGTWEELRYTSPMSLYTCGEIGDIDEVEFNSELVTA